MPAATTMTGYKSPRMKPVAHSSMESRRPGLGSPASFAAAFPDCPRLQLGFVLRTTHNIFSSPLTCSNHSSTPNPLNGSLGRRPQEWNKSSCKMGCGDYDVLPSAVLPSAGSSLAKCCTHEGTTQHCTPRICISVFALPYTALSSVYHQICNDATELAKGIQSHRVKFLLYNLHFLAGQASVLKSI